MVLDVGFMRPLLVWRGYWIDEGYVMSEWIKCSDQMPDLCSDVIVSDGCDIGVMWFGSNGWDSWHPGNSVPNHVTHWMPLPEPPTD